MLMNYELIDSGEGEKLERFGDTLMRRPDPEALWHKALKDTEWKKANLSFVRIGGWSGKRDKKSDVKKEWLIEHAGMKFVIQPTSFKHVGLFPEQEENWKFIKNAITNYELRCTNIFRNSKRNS